jgi:hypothetical protein
MCRLTVNLNEKGNLIGTLPEDGGIYVQLPTSGENVITQNTKVLLK